MKPHHKIAVESLLTSANAALDLLGRTQIGTIEEHDLKTFFGLKRAIELANRVIEDIEKDELGARVERAKGGAK